ncbi:MAG TPA: hypothetical protein PLB05_05200 [Candidatus Omnitrophota bacterium]|nr:hypothetical protein [Candidatus Omnitrophota bacterium]HPN56697.1 hypothetical protein [Candidatus Omnitrophota bacterium]
MLTWETRCTGNRVAQLADGYLSYNPYPILGFEGAEIAIVFYCGTQKIFAIILYDTSDDFAQFHTVKECLDFARKLITDGKARQGTASSWDFAKMCPN